MKNYLLILLLSFTLLYSQQNKKSTAQQNNIESQISNRDSQIQELKYENKILKERLEQASDTLSNQNSMVSGFSVIYTIITIFIAILGISLPFVTYFYGIKPSKVALAELEKNIDKKMGEYMEKSRNIQIDKAIENLSKGNQEEIINAVNYLSITNNQGFQENQIFKIFQVLRESNLDDIKKGVIANLLSNKKNIYATDYFKSTISLSGNLKAAAIKYFANIGISDYIQIFQDLLKNATDQNSEFYIIMTYCAMSNKNAVISLFNSKEFIDTIDEKFGEVIKSNLTNALESFAKGWSLTEDEIKKTYLFEKFN